MGTAATVFLTRHGLSEHNLSTRFYMGRSPASELTDVGRAQARRLGERLAERRAVGHLVASSLLRAVETARIVAQRLGVAEVHEDDAFWELSKGDWEGRMPRDGVPAAERRQLAADPLGFRYPGGESFALVERRVAPAFRRWLERFPAGGVLFVLHGDVICALLHALLEFPAADISRYLVRPCSLTELAEESGRFRLVRFNEDAAAE
jgi:broad specificity phosphatase PhoE